jgi:hypothetical protein
MILARTLAAMLSCKSLKNCSTSGAALAKSFCGPKNSSFFERVGDAEKTQWLPYYYAALSIYRTAWVEKTTVDKDKVADKCNDLISKAQAIENNADLYCMMQQAAVLHMMVDPMSRWQTYGALAKDALANAIKADANNPRIYYLQGMTAFKTPEAFGGGKALAKPLFQKSVDLFKTYVPATPFYPTWGKEEAEKMLAACN